MAKQEEGKWVTINGRHILLKDGESVEQALKRTSNKEEDLVDKKEREIKEHADRAKKLTEEREPYLSKDEQLKLILKTNSANDDIHTWIREKSDILTYAEAIKDTYGDDIDDFTPDFTADDIKRALRTGKITVYSSKPIVNGNFVTPSAMEAASYAGNNGIYKAEVDLRDVAWIDEGQGQLAALGNIAFKKISSKGLV